MSSFLKRLRKKDINPPSSEDKLDREQEAAAEKSAVAAHSDVANASQLNIDVFQTNSAILIYAQVSGASVHDFSVSVEGDNDVVTIKGRQTRPNGDVFADSENAPNNCILGECVWGEFYRQVILPTEVDSSQAEAKTKNGVLVLRLPLKESTVSGTRINVTEA